MTKPREESRKSRSSYGVYDKINYILMAAGVLILIIGYALMAGGKQAPDQFNFEEIYSFRRITLAPIVIILGFLVEVYAVIRKPKSGSGDPS